MNEIYQTHFGRISYAVKHGLAKECSADRHAIEPPHEFSLLPAFNTVCVPHLVEFNISPYNVLRNPGTFSVSTLFDCASKVAIHIYIERLLPDQPGQGPGYVKRFEGQDGARIRGIPVDHRARSIFSHRKTSEFVPGEQHFRCKHGIYNLDRIVLAAPLSFLIACQRTDRITSR